MSAGPLLPRITVPPPGPRSRELSDLLALYEAPGAATAAVDRPAVVWQEAWGANVRDVDGNVYIDLTSGFGAAAIGHRHPRVLAALADQASLLIHALGDVAAHPLRPALAARLSALAPVARPTAAPSQVFFAVSGSEAVEIALKTALAATLRPGIVAFSPCYHGLTLGALAVTSRAEFRQPFFLHLHQHVHRLAFGADTDLLARLLTDGGIGAVLLEPIVGREGVLLPPPGWIARIAALCREHGALLIADEVFTGFGRTGSLFAIEAEGAVPDILCCGKALGGGLPIGAVIASPALFSVWKCEGEALHTSTFLGHPLACAAAMAVLDVLEQERLVERAAGLGRRLAARLAPWAERHPVLAAVRGRGLLWGLELTSADRAHRLAAEALRRGVLMLAGGAAGNVAQIAPPLSIEESQLDHALDLLDEALADLD